MMPARPPRFIRFLVRLIVPRNDREYFLGDLEESSHRRPSGLDTRVPQPSWLREVLGALQLRISPRRTALRSATKRGDTMPQELVRDVRFALRMMARSPGFTIVALITMTLGIGANTAIFSVVNGVLLKPLPYPEGERIVYLRENNLPRGWSSFTISPLNLWDWQAQNRTLELIAAYRLTTATYTGGDRPETLRAYQVSEAYLRILGGEPLLGRGITKDDLDPRQEDVVLLDHGFWRQTFGADPGVLGRIMTLNGEPHTIIGVLPEGWRPISRSGIDIVVPLRLQPSWKEARGSHFLYALGRMKPGVTVEQAQADLSAVAAVLEAEYPESNAGWGASVTALDEILVAQTRPVLGMLMASVGLVLLIACVNVAQMTFARAGSRGREIAIRTALGAGRGRVVRQLLCESLLLAALGGALGFLVAAASLKALFVGWPRILPRMEEIDLSGTVLLFTAGLSLASGVLFGLFPALSVASSKLAEALRQGGWSATGDASRRRLRASLVLVEVSLATVLLVGSGLLVRSLLALQHEDPGFDAGGRLALSTPLPGSKYPTAEDMRAYGDATLERLATIPGVESAAITTLIPVSGQDEIWSIWIEGRPQSGPEDAISALMYRVSPGYFATTGIPLTMGREFTPSDRENTARVAVVSASFAETHFPGEDPLGKRFRFGAGVNDQFVEIVGVAGDVQHYRVGRTSMPQVYLPFAQQPSSSVRFVIKASAPPLSLVRAIRSEIQAVDPDRPLVGVQTWDQIVAADMSTPRFQAMLVSAFGLTALLLAVVGLYGVMSYAVAQRTREFGMRMALGATPSSILTLVLRDGFPPVAGGVVVGLGAALALTRMMQAMLFGVQARDAVTFTAVPILLAIVAALAMLVPAVRATRVDPVETLAAE